MNETTILGMLFAQLVWPSLLVRERACTEIAKLLANPDYTEIVTSFLISWLKKQDLESVVCNGVLAVVRAKMLEPAYSTPDSERISRAINKPSLLSWMLLRTLYPEFEDLPEISTWYSGDAPENFAVEAFFDKYATAFLLPVYYDFWVPTIERKTRLPFRRQWAREWQRAVGETQISVSTLPLDFWLRRREGEFQYAGADMKMSEVYRSAYLRALAWFLDSQGEDLKEVQILASTSLSH